MARPLHTELVALTTFSDLVQEAREQVKRDAIAASLPDDGESLRDGGSGAGAYGEAVATIEALALDKLADYNNTICTWNSTNQNVGHLFTKQAIPMAWDFPETTPLHGVLPLPAIANGVASQRVFAKVRGKSFQLIAQQ